MSITEKILETGILPDWVIRSGIRANVQDRYREVRRYSCVSRSEHIAAFKAACERAPIAVATDKANDQHYEVTSTLFEIALGPNLKYSSCLFPKSDSTLEEAEIEMLLRTTQRAEILDGQKILELGCGWGSLTLFMAKNFPNSHITAVSNSNSQREFIEARAQAAGYTNITVITSDINEFNTEQRFDRVVSVEMFEHLRNHSLLMRKISKWLNPRGKLFVHIFVHRDTPYLYETEGADNWMGRNFFSGGMMPSADLLLRYQNHLTLEEQWNVCGTHYARTAACWLENITNRRQEALRALAAAYGSKQAYARYVQWRVFFMACEELFGYDSGNEWFVAHYRFHKGSGQQ